jgi:large subunit ribosomal protein L14
MIRSHSKLKVADNTGAKVIQVITVLGGSHQQFGKVGDVVSASVKQALPHSTMTEGEKVHAVIIRTKKEYRRKDGTYIRFDDNAAVIIDKDSKSPVGTRIFGPIARELKARGFKKIISLAPEVL